jgi:hypothetical protein
MLTTVKTAPGEFNVCWNGQPTDYVIINGSHGFRGLDAPNTYGIMRGGNVRWIGSLASTKKICAVWLAKAQSPRQPA